MTPAPLQDRLVLHHFLLAELGAETLDRLAGPLRDPDLELAEADGSSRFLHALVAHRSPSCRIDPAELAGYDLAIGAHTRAISERRSEPIRWRYFQYLMLLVTERYLDRLFGDARALLADLNRHREGFNAGLASTDRLPPYVPDDLRKLAFWSATGSGKTLLMHVNLLQYRRHLERHGRTGELNRVILLTPNEGLSHQHVVELRRSGIEAEILGRDQLGLWSGRPVEIIDIHKLREREGERTVAVDGFERNNLVLVDEGHRGAGGEVWMDVRDRLSAEGFSFEYSATFGQALAADTPLATRYAKWIAFDYSYGRFHADGYGKDFRILNLPREDDAEAREAYLAAACLSFCQQRRLFADRPAAMRRFGLQPPLWIFVGSSVRANAVRSEGGRAVSDVLDVLLTFARLLARPAQTAAVFERLLRGEAGLLDAAGEDVFRGVFPYLGELGWDGETAYREMVRRVFNAPAPGPLRAVLLRGLDGEIALQVGENAPFGIVNVGDAPRLHRLCREHPELVTDEVVASESPFRRIESDGSPITLLIGAKRFIEGWSSWRVSSIGLMRVGRGEGPQIIQLFGRGVRLKGLDMSLRRSARVEPPITDRPAHIGLLETLTVFGIRADYMAAFRDQLAKDGVAARRVERIGIPVRRTAPWPDHLRTIRLPPGADFGRGQRSVPVRGGGASAAPVTVDWYPRVQAAASDGVAEGAVATKARGRLGPAHVAFIDVEWLLRELVRFKRERGWTNLELGLDDVRDLLGRHDWYELLVPPERLALDRFERVREWREIALALLKAWCERRYARERSEWEGLRLRYAPLGEDDPNVLAEHGVLVAAESRLARELAAFRDEVAAGRADGPAVERLTALDFDRHLYRPLLTVEGASELQVEPAPLNVGEARFVRDLREWAAAPAGRLFLADRELHLLRNLSRGRGVGFFEGGNFYPDFIVWLVERRVQRVLFVDPKGLVHLHQGLEHPKIRFRRAIKQLETRLGDPGVVLSSFILSVTRFDDLPRWERVHKAELEREHVLFQLDDPLTYIPDMLARALADGPGAGRAP